MNKIDAVFRDSTNLDELIGGLSALVMLDHDRDTSERAALALVKKAVSAGAKIADDSPMTDQAKAAARFLQNRQ